MNWLERYLGGRRFMATMIGGAGTFALCWAGHIDGEAYQWTTVGLLGAYITGNTVQKVKGTGPPPP